MVFHRSFQNKLEHALDIRVGHFIELMAVPHLFKDKVVVKRLVYALTDELRTDYQQCMEQAAAWSKYVIPAYSF